MCSLSYFYTGAQCGALQTNQGHKEPIQHQPFPMAARVVVEPSRGRGWRRSNRHGQPPVASHPCNQVGAAQDQPRLCQEGQQPKAPMLQEGDGGSSHVAWWRVALPRAVPGPPMISTMAQLLSLHPAHTQRHLLQPKQQPRPPVSRMEGKVVWLARLGRCVGTVGLGGVYFILGMVTL